MDVDAIKERNRQIWGLGDYAALSEALRPAAEALADACAVSAGQEVLDVAAGDGNFAIACAREGASVVASDLSPGMVERGRARSEAEGYDIEWAEADAEDLPFEDGRFDCVGSVFGAMMAPRPRVVAEELFRVVRPGGTVALYVWDYAGHMQVMRTFFDAACELDPRAREFDDGVKAPVCRPGPLLDLLKSAGLLDVMVQAIDIPTAFDTFDDYWTPFLGGTGSAPKYCMLLGEEERESLRETIRGRLPTGPDGEILLAARAWAVRGRVPEA